MVLFNIRNSYILRPKITKNSYIPCKNSPIFLLYFGKDLVDSLNVYTLYEELFKENMLMTKLIEHQNNMCHTINERRHKIHTEQVITLP